MLPKLAVSFAFLGPHIRRLLVAPLRHLAAAHQFGRFWIEADIGSGFMSTRPSPDSVFNRGVLYLSVVR